MSTPETNSQNVADPAAAGSVTEKRSKIPSYLVIAATVLAVLASVTTWVRVQALDTDEWVELSNELLDEPMVREALAAYLVDSLYESVDVGGDVDSRLPDELGGLGGLIAGVLRDPLTNSVEQILDSGFVKSLWENANREAHEAVVAILRDEVGTAISTADGEVALELGDVLRALAVELGFSGERLDALPDDAGRIVIFESDELDTAQTGVRILEVLSWFLFIVVVGLYALAVYLASAADRFRVLRSVGFGLVIAGVIELFIRAIGVRIVVDAIVADPSNKPVARQAAYIVTRLIGQAGWTMIILGVLISGFAALLGSGKRARATRSSIASVSNGSPAVAIGATVLVIAVLAWWSPGRMFDSWFNGLFVIVLVVAAAVTLRRVLLVEFPPEAGSPEATAVPTTNVPEGAESS